MNWLPAIPTLLIAAGVLLIPGYALAWIIGLRSHWRVGLAAPLTVTGVAMASFVLQRIGVAWSVVSVAGFMVALAVLLALLFRVFLRPRVNANPEPSISRGQSIALFAGVAIGSLLLAYRVAQGIGDPENISQTFDNVFHLNALRFVLDTGSASPMTIAEVNSPGAAGFYPSAWHAVTSLVVMLSGASLPVAVSAVSVVVGSIVTVLSFSLLVRQIVGSSAAVMVAFGVVVAAFAAFPMLLLFFGVLYPLFLGVALVPALIAVLVNTLGIRPGAPALGTSLSGAWVLLTGLIPGVMLAHPGAFLAGLAAAVPLVLTWAGFQWAGRGTKTRKFTAAAVIAFLLGGLGVYILARPPQSFVPWGPTTQFQDGVVQAVTLTMRGASVSLALILFVVVGIVVAVRRRTPADIALLGMYVVFVLLFAVAAGIDNATLRYWAVGPWYADIPRLASFVPIAAIPLAALGLATIVSSGVAWLSAAPARAKYATPFAIAAILAAVLSTQGTSVLAMATQMRSAYESKNDAALVSADERELLNRLDQHVPEDAMVAGSAWTGAGMAYALAGRSVLMTHTFMGEDAGLDLINDTLNVATPGSAVCGVIDDRNVQFVLDFGSREVHGGKHEFTGLAGLATSDAVRLVDQEGDAKLYEIVGCD